MDAVLQVGMESSGCVVRLSSGHSRLETKTGLKKDGLFHSVRGGPGASVFILEEVSLSSFRFISISFIVSN